MCKESYRMLNPALQCEDGAKQGEWDYEPLRDALLTTTNNLMSAGDISHISIFFRDLDHGPRFGIGEYGKFHPASLRKLPIMIAYLHMADSDPGILERTLSFTGALKINLNIEESQETLKPNTPYTVRELLRKMIVYSDNYSYTLLTNSLNANPPIIPYYTFRDLGVLKMMIDPQGDFISIESYSGLFAILYNTGYLSKDMSEFGLELLDQAVFDKGIVAGVPPDIHVAHKFGERFVSNEEGQLHDCGIVHHPAATYILCVMTTGKNVDKQGATIAEISRIVYGAVSSLSF